MLLALIAALVGGLALLAVLSEQFVIGSARLASALGVSSVVIGAVVIGLGTSLPELLVSAVAAASGSPDIALGNVVGSNIANLSLVLGTGAIVAPVVVGSGVIKREAPLAIGAMLALAIVLATGATRAAGILLIVGLVAALALIVWGGMRAPDDPIGAEAGEALDGHRHRPSREALRALVGLVGTLAGAQLMVIGARGIAEEAGLSEGLVGLTIVAIGTSLPELFTAVQAARKGETDLVVGNVVGSNIFNSLGIAGVAIVIAPGAVAGSIAGAGSVAMVALGIVALGLMITGSRVTRWEGVALLVIYAALVSLLL